MIAGIIFVLMYGFAYSVFQVVSCSFRPSLTCSNLTRALHRYTWPCVVMIGGGIDISVGAVCGLVTVACAMLLESGNEGTSGRLIFGARDRARLWAHAWISHCLS